MKIAKTRVVFDRQRKATKKVSAAVYIEVSYDRVRNFYNTGVKVCSHQFKDGKIVNCGHMAEYQERIRNVRNMIEDFINVRMKKGENFSLDGLKEFMERKSSPEKCKSFIDYAERRIWERTDIAEPRLHNTTQSLSQPRTFYHFLLLSGSITLMVTV